MTDFVNFGLMPRAGSTKLLSTLSRHSEVKVLSPSMSATVFKDILVCLDTTLKTSDHEDRKSQFLITGMRKWVRWEKDKIVIDKDRDWSFHLKSLPLLFEEPKSVFLVRDIRGSICSFLKLIEKQGLSAFSGLVPQDWDFYTIADKCDFFLKREETLGKHAAWINAKITSNETFDSDKVLFVRFEDMLIDYDEEVNKVRKFIGITSQPSTESDLKQEEEDNMAAIEFQQPGLHVLKGEGFVSDSDRIDDVIPKEISENIIRRFYSYYEKFYPNLLKEYIL